MTHRTAPTLFCLDARRDYAERVAAYLELPLAAHEERRFEDGEHKSRPLFNVGEQDVYVIHSLNAEPGQSPNDKLCRLLFFIGALKDAGAGRVTAVVPYLCYARKDRRTQPRDPVTTRYVAGMFEAVGADRIMTFDVHNLAAFENAFRCRAENLEALPLFVEHFRETAGERPVTVVAPDFGAAKRAERFRHALEAATGRAPELAFMEKQRAGGVVTGGLLGGELAGRDAIIIDDLISTGGTLRRTAAACREAGARSVLTAATHGLFVPGAEALLRDQAIDRIVVADTVALPRLDPGLVAERLTVLDSSGLLADAIRQVHAGQ